MLLTLLPLRERANPEEASEYSADPEFPYSLFGPLLDLSSTSKRAERGSKESPVALPLCGYSRAAAHETIA
jgi:hypothetical protein